MLLRAASYLGRSTFSICLDWWIPEQIGSALLYSHILTCGHEHRLRLWIAEPRAAQAIMHSMTVSGLLQRMMIQTLHTLNRSETPTGQHTDSDSYVRALSFWTWTQAGLDNVKYVHITHTLSISLRLACCAKFSDAVTQSLREAPHTSGTSLTDCVDHSLSSSLAQTLALILI